MKDNVYVFKIDRWITVEARTLEQATHIAEDMRISMMQADLMQNPGGKQNFPLELVGRKQFNPKKHRDEFIKDGF